MTGEDTFILVTLQSRGYLGASAVFAESLKTEFGVWFISRHLMVVQWYAKSSLGMGNVLHPEQHSSPGYQ